MFLHHLNNILTIPLSQYLPVHLRKGFLSITLLLCMVSCFSQTNKIKCYFNHPVNNSISTGMNAVYLNGKFPDTIAAYINRAKFTIDIAMYNFTSATNSNVYKIAVAANAAAARGVAIRWIYNGTSATNNTGLSLLSPLIKTFASANYSDYIMHNKFMVIDANAADSTDAIAQSGSYNWSDQQTTGDYNNIIFVQSKQVALAYYREFNKMWGGTGADPVAASATFSSFKNASSQTKFLVDDKLVEVYFSPKDSLGRRLQSSIATADHDLFFGIYTFTRPDIANLIKTEYDNGVFVRGIMDNFSQQFSAYGILNPALGSKMITYNGAGVYHNKILLVDGQDAGSDPQVATGSFNWSTQAQESNDENMMLIHDAGIANQYYQSLCADYTGLGGLPCTAPPCPNANTIFTSNIRGNSYQWQLNTGSGFSNINDNSNYSGTTTENLLLNNVPSSWYGCQFRCVIDGTAVSDTSTLKFTAYWNGSTSTAWENTANWNCGAVPDANTDVVINRGVKFFPSLNLNTACRSIRLTKDALVILSAGVNLMLTGK